VTRAACNEIGLLRHHGRMNAYSEDLRKKIVEAVERGMPKIEAARTFGVGISSVKRYVATYRERRSLAPKKRPGSKPKRDEDARKSFWRRTWRTIRRQPCPRGASSCDAYVEFRSATPRFPGCSDA
jgi:transposase-like protein